MEEAAMVVAGAGAGAVVVGAAHLVDQVRPVGMRTALVERVHELVGQRVRHLRPTVPGKSDKVHGEDGSIGRSGRIA